MAVFDYFISVTGDCANTNVGAISLSLSGGTPPYTVEWIEPPIGASITTDVFPIYQTSLSASTYAVRVIDSTLDENLEFYINIPISSGLCASIVATTNTYCGEPTGSVTATTTSYFSTTDCYLYNSEDELISNNIFNSEFIVFENLSADTYYLRVVDLGGCSATTESFIINSSNAFDFGYYTINASPCFSGSTGKIYITGQTNSGPYTYFWSDGSTGSTLTNLSAGSYSVDVTDGEGCTKTKIIDIFNVDSLGLANITPTQPTCFSSSGSLDITISGGTEPFYYSANTGYYNITYDRNFKMTNLAAGSYEILVKDAALCEFTIFTSLVRENGITSVSINGTNSQCSKNNGSIEIIAFGGSPPYRYGLIDYLGNTTEISTTFTNYIFDNLSGDNPTGYTYTAYVQDLTNCYVSEEITIITEDKFTLNYSTTGTTCGGGNGTIFAYVSSGATAPYDYYLNNVSIIDTNLTGVTFQNVVNGQYILRVVDADGCEKIQNIQIGQSGIIDFSLYPISCVNGNDASITALITNGAPPFTFNWSSNVVGNPQYIAATGLTSGDYSLTIVDSNGCSLTRQTSINCFSATTSYQVYSVDSQTFGLQPLTNFGLLDYLNEGFTDLVNLEFSGSTNTSPKCVLNSAVFTLEYTLEPSGLTSGHTFYTGYSRTDVPTDSYYLESISDLIINIPGIQDVSYDLISNTINIIAQTDSGLTLQLLTINLKIAYDISCT
jgi:hypothetical protein